MSTKYQWLVTIVVLAMLIISFSLATAMLMPVNEQSNDKTAGKKLTPVVNDDDEIEMVKIVFYVKPENPGGGKKPPKDKCVDLMGVKWKSTPVAYTINPTNAGMNVEFVKDTIQLSAETWDAETSTELFDDTYTVDYSAKFGTQDYENVIAFGDYDDGVIGVAYVWSTKRGKQIVEFDMLFNTNDFIYGNADIAAEPVMDLQNICTHELGHAVGLADVYHDDCDHVTMYGYADYDETIKRTLETSDINGLQEMYGE